MQLPLRIARLGINEIWPKTDGRVTFRRNYSQPLRITTRLVVGGQRLAHQLQAGIKRVAF